MVRIAFVVGAAIIAVTIMMTAARYRVLPDRIPIHFRPDGRPDYYGPRQAAWLCVGFQLFVLVTVVLVSAKGSAPGIFVLCDISLAGGLFAQAQILSVAANPHPRLDMRIFWLALVGTLAVVLIAHNLV